jgi:hypothetical protein
LRLVGPFADLVLGVGASSPGRERFVAPEDALALLRPALALSSGHSMAHSMAYSMAYRDLRTLVFEICRTSSSLRYVSHRNPSAERFRKFLRGHSAFPHCHTCVQLCNPLLWHRANNVRQRTIFAYARVKQIY